MNLMRRLCINMLLCCASLALSADLSQHIICSKNPEGYSAYLLLTTEDGARITAQVQILKNTDYLAEYIITLPKGALSYQQDPEEALREAKTLYPSLSEDVINHMQAFFNTFNSAEAIEQEIELQEKERREKIELQEKERREKQLNSRFKKAWTKVDKQMDEVLRHHDAYRKGLIPPRGTKAPRRW